MQMHVGRLQFVKSAVMSLTGVLCADAIAGELSLISLKSKLCAAASLVAFVPSIRLLVVILFLIQFSFLQPQNKGKRRRLGAVNRKCLIDKPAAAKPAPANCLSNALINQSEKKL